METTILNNGAEEATSEVKVVMMSLEGLISENPIAFYELAMCCRDRERVPFGSTAEKLSALALYPVHDSIRNIVLSAVKGDGLEMTLGSPLAEAKAQAPTS